MSTRIDYKSKYVFWRKQNTLRKNKAENWERNLRWPETVFPSLINVASHKGTEIFATKKKPFDERNMI